MHTHTKGKGHVVQGKLASAHLLRLSSINKIFTQFMRKMTQGQRWTNYDNEKTLSMPTQKKKKPTFLALIKGYSQNKKASYRHVLMWKLDQNITCSYVQQNIWTSSFFCLVSLTVQKLVHYSHCTCSTSNNQVKQ